MEEGENDKRASRVYDWLRQDDARLLRDCDQEHVRSSGPGGQRRNKVQTGVRLLHRPSGITAQAVESRSQAENRARALGRLRERIALECRSPFDLVAPVLPPEFLVQRGLDGTLSVNPRHPVYPIILAVVLDALAAASGSYAQAARALGLTTSQLIGFLEADRQAQRAVAQMRGG